MKTAAAGILSLIALTALVAAQETPSKVALPANTAASGPRTEAQGGLTNSSTNGNFSAEERQNSASWALTPQFEFKGGSLKDFIAEVKTRYNFDLAQAAGLSSHTISIVSVPKINVGPSTRTLAELLEIYNLASKGGVEGMGEWIMEPRPMDGWTRYAHTNAGPKKPIVIVFKEPEQNPAASLRVFSLESHHATRRAQLEELLSVALEAYTNMTSAAAVGELRFHDRSRNIIAVGDKAYIEVVTEVVKGFKESNPSRF